MLKQYLTLDAKFCKAFANGSSANIKCSKTHLSKIERAGRSIPIPSLFRAPILPKTPF